MRGPVDVHRHGALTLVLRAGALEEALGVRGDPRQVRDADDLALGGGARQAQTTGAGGGPAAAPAPR